MPEALRELRVGKQLPAKEMVAVVQALYPKYDKTVQSKCENGGEYGVSIRPDAMQALYERFAPELLEVRRKKKDGGHCLICRISCRLEEGDFKSLQQHISAEGFSTMQNWITHVVRQYIKHYGDAKKESLL